MIKKGNSRKQSFRQSGRVLLLIALLLGSLSPAVATVDYLVVNHWTEEYYWADDDHGPGWIGWEVVPEGDMDTAPTKFRMEGYKETTFPWKIELRVFLVSLLIFGGWWWKKSRRA